MGPIGQQRPSELTRRQGWKVKSPVHRNQVKKIIREIKRFLCCEADIRDPSPAVSLSGNMAAEMES